MEEIDLILEEVKEQMQNSIAHLEKELLKVRAGRANPSMLEGVRVEYYGSPTPLSQVSNISTPDARTLAVQPWEKGLITEIERGIMNANLGLNPQNNGEMVIINIPALTEERRKELVKRARNEGEEARIALRNARKDGNDMLKKLADDDVSEDIIKDGEAEVQSITDGFNKKIEAILEKKEADIMHV
jgi:ribosome recycling factor